MKLKKNVKIALAVAATLCVILAVWLVTSRGKTDQNTDANQSSVAANNQTNAADSSKKENTADKEKTENESEETRETTGSDQNGNNSNNNNNNATVNAGVSLPYTLPNSSLVAEDIRSFDGQFIEDGSDEEVSGVAVLILTNTGSTPVEYADIELGDYQFIASAIAPGATVIVQEKDRKEYTGNSSFTCTTHIANINSFDYSDDVTITENEDSITVKNVSGADIPCVRIFYKMYMADEDVYVGGITYTAKITDLEADSSVTVTPTHYLQGYSEILMVRTYDTAD